MTPPSYEVQLWLNWIPWENTVQYQLVTLQERATQSAAPLEWCSTCPLHTAQKSTALELTGMEPQSQSQARDPRDPSEGAQ